MANLQHLSTLVLLPMVLSGCSGLCDEQLQIRRSITGTTIP
jgi:hypothetical protein